MQIDLHLTELGL